MNRALSPYLAALASLVASACGNPAVDARIEALGEEDPDVPPGEHHRPGQPCVLCHGPYYGAEPLMSIGGTVYATPSDDTPVAGAVVTLFDSQGDTRSVSTNCIGNFFITKDQWDPLFPLHAELAFEAPGSGVQKRVVMSSRISRDGSCAACHEGTPNQGSPGWVYVAAAGSGVTFPKPDASCPGAK
jgi:hypothetical protein